MTQQPETDLAGHEENYLRNERQGEALILIAIIPIGDIFWPDRVSNKFVKNGKRMENDGNCIIIYEIEYKYAIAVHSYVTRKPLQAFCIQKRFSWYHY